MRYLWLALGWTALGLGIIGAFLPLLPTTPFLLLAAFAFSKGSERLHAWIMEHPSFGPPIKQWQEHRAISRQVKIYATVSIGVVFAITLALGVVWWAVATQAAILTVVLYFIWSRPE